jgi:hypothetical protein
MGRPSFNPTDEQRAEVARLKQAKVSIEEIARKIDVTPKTLRKAFATELGLIPVETVNTVLNTARPRPTNYRPTSEQRELVLILSGGRMPRLEIAATLEVGIDVLEEHFGEELDNGPTKSRAAILVSMYNAGKGGNVAAAKVYLLFNGQEEPNPDQQPAKAGLVGKKESQSIAARTAEGGTAWADLVTAKPN